ncbi:alpha/beta fold hydrolase [uncultured Brevibacillus sp.]|uniref:alpha/beta fold hydrolase n=1 Tax=uncultured Brevibacillus sp. TaxID=169970 RepID=UPI0025951BB8|nr:alpha/beta hydrolase [uncultured Brevibacillus sp.]
MEQVMVQLKNGQLASTLSGKGTPVLCIHAPCIGSMNFSQQHALSDAYQLIVPDLPGHGSSSSFGGRFSIGELADYLNQLTLELNITQSYLLGYSQGASIALEYCLRYPEKVKGVILVSAFSEVKDFYLHGRFFMAQTLSWLHGIPLLARSIASSHVNDPAIHAKWVEHASRTDARSLASLYGAGHRYRCTERLDELRMPALLVYGKEDRQMQPYAQLFKKQLPGANLLHIPHVHHQVITRAAPAFNQLCRDFMQ